MARSRGARGRERASWRGADTFLWFGGDTVVVQTPHWIPEEVL